MLRHYDQHAGGVRVYTRQVLRAMLQLNRTHEFVFLYRNASLIGTYAHEAAVTEIALPGRHVLWWDQVEVPKSVRRMGIDVLYNPKYSIPLDASCATSWVCHGLDWYVMPWASRRIDRLSHKYLVPRYARKAGAIIAVSEVTREHVLQYLRSRLTRYTPSIRGSMTPFAHLAMTPPVPPCVSATASLSGSCCTQGLSIRQKILRGWYRPMRESDPSLACRS